MTSDKQNAGNVASKPFTPSLSAAFHRTNKPPLTPKLATPNSGGYRTPRRLAPSEHPSSTATTPSKDDYLGANVTPRSSSRTSRRDVVNGSPTSTPSGPLSAPQTPYSQPGMAPGSVNGGPYRSERSPVRAGMKLEPPRPNRARTLTAESQHHGSRPVSSPDASAGARRFFHASDARSSNSPDPEPRPTKSAGKSSSPATFFYANGREERPPGEDSAKRRSTGPNTRAAASSKAPPTPSSTSASPSPRFKLSNGANEPGRLSDSLAPSVSSDEARESPSHRLSAPSSHLPERPPPVPLRRHIKSSSVDSGSSALSPREALRPSPNILSPSDPQVPQIDTNVGANNNNNDAMSAADAIQAILPRLFSNMSNGSGDTHASNSPVKSDTTSQSTNDPAANARVGRKIMDLEISNSSLLAINRTLEREMRKQNAELRRFRRLSRAGHFSATPARSASGPSLDTTQEVEEGSSEISNTQSTDDLSDISDEEDDEEGDSTDEGVMSPGSLAEHDAKHRVSDEKHVFTDLAKHQELLVDSQKMNQSLRRCLGWTEELIREGQKALEYNVHVNDVELGGRVLAPEELLDIGESARGLLSSSATSDYKSDMSSVASYDMDDSASVSTATDVA